MFSPLILFFVAVVTSARMERHVHVRRNSTGQCNTGNLQCCQNLFNTSEHESTLNLLSVPYNSPDTFGIDCTPLNLDGAGEGAACQQQPVCCSGNTYRGFVNMGCSPWNLN